MEPNSLLVLAAALDSRFKSLQFPTDDLKQLVTRKGGITTQTVGNIQVASVKDEQSPPAKKQE